MEKETEGRKGKRKRKKGRKKRLERTIKELPTINRLKRSVRRMDIETLLDWRL